jgi:thioesterase domain-containing protein
MWARPAPPWEGHTTVIASEWEADYVAQTWPYLAPRHLDIVGVPGTHTSMLSVEHVEATADAVRTSIERVFDISPD